MKPSEYKETYQWYSGKTSDVVRQLSFAGIAIIWIFKVQSQGIPKIPNVLLVPLGLFCISLAFDLLQYVLGYIIWYIFFRFHEKKGIKENHELTHNVLLPVPLHLCMIIKVLAVILAYYKLIVFIYNSWAPLLSKTAMLP